MVGSVGFWGHPFWTREHLDKGKCKGPSTNTDSWTIHLGNFETKGAAMKAIPAVKIKPSTSRTRTASTSLAVPSITWSKISTSSSSG
jgi:hypothetical protein